MKTPAVEMFIDSQAVLDIIQERERQFVDEGWTPSHDDEHADGSLAGAAACYTFLAEAEVNPELYEFLPRKDIEALWPWAPDSFKPKDARRNLVRAGALIVAEIERLDRLAPAHGDKP